MDALVLVNSLIYTTPSSDRQGVAEKQKTWDKFIGSLTLKEKSVTLKKKKSPSNFLGALGRIGINVPKKE